VQSGFASSAARDRLEDSENYQAKPEINCQSGVNVTRHVPRSWRQVRNEDKVNRISCQNGNQGLDEISHCGFGHRCTSDQRDWVSPTALSIYSAFSHNRFMQIQFGEGPAKLLLSHRPWH
jgi:hypothetical protein